MSDQIADFVYGIPSSKSLVASLESALKVSELTFPARNEEDRLCGRLVAGKSADRNRVLPFRQHVELAEFPVHIGKQVLDSVYTLGLSLTVCAPCWVSRHSVMYVGITRLPPPGGDRDLSSGRNSRALGHDRSAVGSYFSILEVTTVALTSGAKSAR